MKNSERKPGVAPAPPGEGEFSLIPRHKLLDLYAAMLKCRAIADRLPTAVRGRSKSTIAVPEAVSSGVTIDLLASDAISPALSDLTACAVKGVALKPLLRWWSDQLFRVPASRVPAQVARANVIAPSPSIAARLEATLRLADHFRAENNGSVVVFFAAGNSFSRKPAGEPAISQQLLQSFLRQASDKCLPILFVGQSGQDNGELLSISHRCGVPGMAVDCNDVVAVYRVAFEALSHARHGNGPTLIDSRPWRLNGRVPKDRKSRDSIGKMEAYLAGKDVAYRPVKDRVLRQIASQFGR